MDRLTNQKAFCYIQNEKVTLLNKLHCSNNWMQIYGLKILPSFSLALKVLQRQRISCKNVSLRILIKISLLSFEEK